MIYEAADYGGLGTIDKVKRVKVYEFFDYLSFQRILNARNDKD
jgi:hypothetical protein